MSVSLRELVPPLLAMDFMFIDTPTHTFNGVVYNGDKNEFNRLSKQRNSFIRVEYPSEFDWRLSISDRSKAPVLRVLVFRFAPAIHARIPVFRGSPSVNLNVVSDAEVGNIVAGMVREYGVNRAECRTYEETIKAQSAPTPTEAIH